MRHENEIILKHIEVKEDIILLHFNEMRFNAWLENTNKHIPDIYELKKECGNFFSFNCNKFPDIPIPIFLKLSLGDFRERLSYSLPHKYSKHAISKDYEIILKENQGHLILVVRNKSNIFLSKDIDSVASKYSTDNGFKKIEYHNKPVNVCVIGSCFSRSIFRSDKYFNPEYKKFFTVVLTIFHSSLISLMSKRIEDNEYSFISDLSQHNILRYIKIEFLKDVKERMKSTNSEYIIIDNYSDAALEIVRMNNDSFLTYNKYFSESIFKRKFSGKEILTPGKKKHIERYRSALKIFSLILQELDLDRKLVLIGGRLSEFKNQSERWESKMDWIKNINHNLNIYDSIFLNEFKNSKYIDMRYTNLISDEDSPITGGASPSHYQSEFYKELYKKTLATIYTKNYEL